MFTPQQIDQISFSRSTFGGYDMQQVDEILEPLTEDYVTLYKENALLKSKMRVLVGKLEEYRKNEAAMKDAVVNAQKTCDKMIMEAEAKCAKMMNDARASAPAAAAVSTVDTAANDALVASEKARVEDARRTAAAKISELQEQLRACIQALDRIKTANAPAAAAPVAASADDVADQIAQSVEAIVGSTDEPTPKAPPKHPTPSESSTSKFSSLSLQFGRNYDPTTR